LIEVFGLSIGLQVISGRRCNGVIKEFSKSFREFGDELRASVGDDLIVEPESAVNVFEEKFCYALRGDGFQARSNNYPLHKAVVDHDHNRIKSTRGREIRDEIDR
jgi:hypothetical protein